MFCFLCGEINEYEVLTCTASLTSITFIRLFTFTTKFSLCTHNQMVPPHLNSILNWNLVLVYRKTKICDFTFHRTHAVVVNSSTINNIIKPTNMVFYLFIHSLNSLVTVTVSHLHRSQVTRLWRVKPAFGVIDSCLANLT